MFSTFKEAITKHFKRWLDIDIIVNDVGLIIERLVKQFEKEKRNIIETNIEPPKRTMPISDFSDISDWLPENRKKKYLKVVPPASYPLQINISKGTIVGKVTKKADVWYVHGRYKLICSGKDLTSMLIDTLRVVDIFDIIEVKIKSQEIMDWFNLQKQQTLP